MGQLVSGTSRDAIARARLFVEKAMSCDANARIDFEAFLEAAIVFAKTSVHRLKNHFSPESAWKKWLDGLQGPEAIAVQFFDDARNWILKTASMKVNQNVFVAEGPSDPLGEIKHASRFYYFERPEISASDTVDRHLKVLEQLVESTARKLGAVEGTV